MGWPARCNPFMRSGLYWAQEGWGMEVLRLAEGKNGADWNTDSGFCDREARPVSPRLHRALTRRRAIAGSGRFRLGPMLAAE